MKRELWLIAAILSTGIMGVVLKNQFLNYLFLSFVLVYLSWHILVLTRLSQQLIRGKEIQPPFPGGLWHDVFSQIQRLQRRKKSKGKFSRFREIASSLNDAIIILSEHGVIEWCNPAAQRLLGLFWPKSMGHSIVKLVRHPILEEYIASGDYSNPIEINSPADKARILSLSITRFGKAYHHLVVARDITQIYHLNQAQQDFVANVSHELRTPLTVIMGFLESLQYAEFEQQKWVRSVELMESQARRMQGIIDELLTLSRLHMKAGNPTDETVSVSNLLDSIIKEARVLSGTGAHAITLEINPNLWLKGNSDELRSAFANLIFNAVQHSPPRAEIHIRWDTDEQGAYFTVSDTGEGIAARHIPRLTERFYRVDRARSRKSGGTGLGLAIVKHVLEHHRSELHIASQVGRGSTFTCRFPVERIVSPKVESVAHD